MCLENELIGTGRRRRNRDSTSPGTRTVPRASPGNWSPARSAAAVAATPTLARPTPERRPTPPVQPRGHRSAYPCPSRRSPGSRAPLSRSSAQSRRCRTTAGHQDQTPASAATRGRTQGPREWWRRTRSVAATGSAQRAAAAYGLVNPCRCWRGANLESNVLLTSRRRPADARVVLARWQGRVPPLSLQAFRALRAELESVLARTHGVISDVTGCSRRCRRVG